MYADLAVPLDANIENADVDDDAAIQALMEGTAQGTAPSAPSGRPKSASPKSKGKKKVDDNVICGIPESAAQNLVPDVVLELEESEMANKRGHVVIAIENPNPDLDMSHFSYVCKTEGENGISHLISALCVNCLSAIPEYSRFIDYSIIWMYIYRYIYTWTLNLSLSSSW